MALESKKNICYTYLTPNKKHISGQKEEILAIIVWNAALNLKLLNL